MNFTCILKEAVSFVEKRAKKTGGFGATPNLPATIEDTYHAFRIINLTQRWIGNDPTKMKGSFGIHRAYLRSRMSMSETGPKTLFQLLWSCKFTGLPVEQNRILKLIIDRSRKDSRIESWYYFASILTLFKVEPARILTCKAFKPDVSFFDGISKKRWMALYMDSVLRLKMVDTAKTAAWFMRCQNGDGGFGFMPHTTSYIENCGYSLKALSLLNRPPVNTKAAVRFVLSCRTGSGGFSRNSNSAPFLESTWHAIISLFLLNFFLCHENLNPLKQNNDPDPDQSSPLAGLDQSNLAGGFHPMGFP